MNVAYFEMIGGASGNMLLGALVDAGADAERLEAALRTIPVDGWTIERRRVTKLQIAATYFDFVVPGEDHHADAHDEAHAHDESRAHDDLGAQMQRDAHRHSRHLEGVLQVVARSGLGAEQKRRACEIYVRLAEAEAKVHGTTADRVHFHEVGSTDAILDVAGTCVALDLLEVDSVFCSPFPLGRGSIAMQHGRYPNPPPATAALLLGAPTYDAGIVGEMVTTTGAAILMSFVETPGVRPAMTAQRIGYGAGRSDFAVPNVLRASIGPLTTTADVAPAGPDDVVVLEANIDDMSPQHFELAIERVLAAGAYDVWLAPVTMKKLRPAIVFGAVAPPELEARVAHEMLAQTSTLGVRVRRERRYTLEREIATIATPLGNVRVKTARIDGQPRRTLEYDDVVRIAREGRRPIAEVAARLEEFLPPL